MLMINLAQHPNIGPIIANHFLMMLHACAHMIKCVFSNGYAAEFTSVFWLPSSPCSLAAKMAMKDLLKEDDIKKALDAFKGKELQF